MCGNPATQITNEKTLLHVLTMFFINEDNTYAMKKLGTLVIMLITLLFTTSVLAKTNHRLKGESSYYAEYHHGKLTANGEVFNMYAMTAAHRTLPLCTKVKVTNLRNQKSVLVTINDRGPYAKNRILDLSKGAARKLDMMKSGVATVRIDIVSLPKTKFQYKRRC